MGDCVMSTTLNVPPEITCLTARDLMRRAADREQVAIKTFIGMAAVSQPLQTYQLTNGSLTSLVRIAKGDIKQLGERDQSELKFQVELLASLGICRKKRGVVFTAGTRILGIASEDDDFNLMLFKLLVENDHHASDIAKKLAASDGIVVVSWTELGLGGIRSLSDLAEEFVATDPRISRLGMNLDPDHDQQPPSGKLFVVEQDQPALFASWERLAGRILVNLV